ncbi:hypothetical protein RQP46_004205 [Phenoliferia psychrophenolica]
MAAPFSPPLRSLTFPPEVLLHILSFASDSYSSHHYTNLNKRNADLASLALVSRTFQEATYSVLYGDLRLAWMGDKVKKLLRTFQENDPLFLLVRRLEATAVHRNDWVDYHLENPGGDSELKKQAWLEDYLERGGVEQYSKHWTQMMEDGIENCGAEAEDQWVEDMRSDARDAWDAKGHGEWKRKRNHEGARELLDIMTSATALRSLVLRGFSHKLDEDDTQIYGPFPHLESIAADISASPFFLNANLPSFLAASAPNLRSLSGYARRSNRENRENPVIRLPPSFTRLDIAGYDQRELRLDALLLQVQPTLRSLTLLPASPGGASSPTVAALLSSLETFIVKDDRFWQCPDDIKSLERAITASSSLHHLEGIPATATLIAALPSSLQSITLPYSIKAHEHLCVEIARVLEFLKTATTHPLRVEFTTDDRSRWLEQELDWEEYRDAYAEVGHTLSVRCW